MGQDVMINGCGEGSKMSYREMLVLLSPVSSLPIILSSRIPNF